MRSMQRPQRTWLTCLLWASQAACGDGSANASTVRVQVTAEETITEGLDPGTREENTRDYAVRFDKYLVVIGQPQLARSRDQRRLASEETTLVNLREAGSDGIELSRFEAIAPGVWDKFGYAVLAADENTSSGPSVSEAERATMVDEGLSHWIEGRVLRPAEEGGEVRFVLKANAPTEYSECTYNGEPGVSVVAGGTSTATITLHGDHLFFTSFPATSEQTVERRAAWITKADLDGDGLVDNDELMRSDATELFPQELGYSLAGAPIDILSGFDFARAQLATQGHFRGEGECLWELVE